MKKEFIKKMKEEFDVDIKEEDVELDEEAMYLPDTQTLSIAASYECNNKIYYMSQYNMKIIVTEL